MTDKMTYEDACGFADGTKKYGSILGLDSIRALMGELKDVQKKLSVIHVAGTNGKGSVCAFLSAALTEQGYRVGRFNSPAVFERREVFRIGNTMISEKEYAHVMEKVKNACEKLVCQGRAHPTVFEVECAAAFLWFFERDCDLVLLETGMGGETDATNLILHPVCSVLTSIGLDHMQFLGDSIEEITKVKAGIIKEGCPVVVLRQEEIVNQVIAKKAEEMNAPCIFADTSECGSTELSLEALVLQHPRYGRIHTSLTGAYQRENLTLALKVLEQLEEWGYALDAEKVRTGIGKTIWEGRFEVLRKNPHFILDGAHNPAAVKRLKETLEKDFTNRKIIYIIGVLADKEHLEMAKELLKGAEQVYTVTPQNPRALDAGILAKEVKTYAKKVSCMEEIPEAVSEALKNAKTEDVIVAFGSLSYLGDVRKALCEIEKVEGTGEIHG